MTALQFLGLMALVIVIERLAYGIVHWLDRPGRKNK